MATEFIKAQLQSPNQVDILKIDSSEAHLLKIAQMKERVGEILDAFTEQVESD